MHPQIDKLTVIQFIEYFTEENCIKYLQDLYFSDGVFCPHCGSIKKPYLVNDRTKRKFVTNYRCSERYCSLPFHALTKTVFANCKQPLRNWFYSLYHFSNNKKNISSIQLGKNLGISQKSAWGLYTKVRNVLTQPENIKLSGIVEVDEAFVSPKNNWSRWGAICIRKAPVLGLIERGGKVVVKCIEDRKRDTILEMIEKYVEPGSIIYTDGYSGYRRLPKYYFHDYVNHSEREYVRDEVHTNSIEGFWSYFKKSIRNAHHSISDKHLQSYLDESAFRFNNRHLSQMDRFNMILKRCVINKSAN